ncbi:Glyoxalase/Bleomycin resistance protein/Dihydroxybiphenyl dioxygenase [Calocera viscosa TUFC12733]|uniref:Glyoxalase/Bleomycin resistance protein/Dihydroxybiphenyl dioxygenase n=1 Tax=Calocera viscosa (strain TUFC12733) TaxID=1330018 RepID=A0A167MP09_CALVF|nr:Glyoxalase/Bleomycin resistance protein/Dihydroxybiphenyl dioxygenase [Calocera viscosa TUFC12733]
MSAEPTFLVYLPVTDVEASVKWYTTALGFKLNEATHYPGNYAHIYLGGPSAKESRAQLMLRKFPGEYRHETEGTKPPVYDLMWDVCETGKGKEVVDAWLEKVKKTGVEVGLQGTGAADKEWGTRQFELRDPDGHWVTFFAYL